MASRSASMSWTTAAQTSRPAAATAAGYGDAGTPTNSPTRADSPAPTTATTSTSLRRLTPRPHRPSRYRSLGRKCPCAGRRVTDSRVTMIRHPALTRGCPSTIPPHPSRRGRPVHVPADARTPIAVGHTAQASMTAAPSPPRCRFGVVLRRPRSGDAVIHASPS